MLSNASPKPQDGDRQLVCGANIASPQLKPLTLREFFAFGELMNQLGYDVILDAGRPCVIWRG
jgi:hypothetical protein